MGQYYALSMTFKTEPQGQTLTHIKKTYISVQHINFEENEPSTEKNQPQIIPRQGLVIVNIPCKFEKPNLIIAAAALHTHADPIAYFV